MPGNFKKEDLRILKTKKALMAAMSTLLELRNFSQITVNDLCEEALISRNTFYAHFIDKYDLLKYWLTNIKPYFIDKKAVYKDVEKNVNDLINNNNKIVKNLIENANNETYNLLCDFILSLLHINIDKTDNGHASPKDIVLAHIGGGGILNYLLWQIKNKFPPDLPVMNPYFYEFLINIMEWNK